MATEQNVYQYRYFGLWFGRIKAKVALLSATMQEISDHAAVWVGVNQVDNKSWVQGGVLVQKNLESVDPTTDPYAYIEIMPLHTGEFSANYKILKHPVKWGTVCKVTLHRDLKNRRMWTCKVTGIDRDGKPFTLTSDKVNVPNAQSLATLETFGTVQAKATINGKTVQTPKKKPKKVNA